jgi:CRISPR-associated protein Cmr4
MKTELYTITTLTNMHVGSGDINFDVIDKQVQRDVITNLPVIHSSSLKGAFRENFKKDTNMVKYIFGPENSDNSSHQTGAFSFFEAQLLTRPVRSNVKSHFNATSPSVIKALLEMIDIFDIDFDKEFISALDKFSKLPVQSEKPLIFEDISDVILEDFEATYDPFDTTLLKEFLGDDLALFDDGDFKKLDLPVLARNYLVDSVSENLWYEEIVPKQSKFFFSIAKPTNLDDQDKQEKLDSFENMFENNTRLVQFGANKSIGYGYSRVKKESK